MPTCLLDSKEAIEALDRLASGGPITLIVGAGASREATLPTWTTLLERLLARAASAAFEDVNIQVDEPLWASQVIRRDSPLTGKHFVDLLRSAHSGELAKLLESWTVEKWVSAVIAREGPLGAAAVAESLLADLFHSSLESALYDGRSADKFSPGPIAHQVARLMRALGADVAVATTNYDNLIEQALRIQGVPRSGVRRYISRPSDGNAPPYRIVYLHGYAHPDKTSPHLVLSEGEYHAMQQRTSWQDRYMATRLAESTCIFIGSSLSDPNLIRYLYTAPRAESRRHLVVFVRQAEDDGLPDSSRVALEHSVASRWDRCNVDTLFLDHFADVAQFLHEVGNRRTVTPYYRLGSRVAAFVAWAERVLLRTDDADAFRERQVLLSDALRQALDTVRAIARKNGTRFHDEFLGAAIWLVDEKGECLRNWIQTDRAHRDLRTVDPIPLNAVSKWVAVEAMSRGLRVEGERNVYASRWRYIIGVPLTFTDLQGQQFTFGSITITSSRPRQSSGLFRMSDDVRSEFLDTLADWFPGLVYGLREAPVDGVRATR